jgi:hypothetical protein
VGNLTLILPHRPDAPEAVLFPDAIEAGEGTLAVPGQ